MSIDFELKLENGSMFTIKHLHCLCGLCEDISIEYIDEDGEKFSQLFYTYDFEFEPRNLAPTMCVELVLALKAMQEKYEAV